MLLFRQTDDIRKMFVEQNIVPVFVERKEGNGLFNDALKTFFFSQAALLDVKSLMYLWCSSVLNNIMEGNVLFNDALDTFYLRFILGIL